ncbi:chaperone protein Dnaj 11 chloroplastic [Phtheirospermum japonicum]|uniref:Chaperone protein Dnaj 11 chloroplastic n=1 Tax=Phtheirospermum japonicum TaxID=374723 RepID=A0A830CEE0_9LAMI|nr:chaperone protein Dnaj 11 chloroplastic [Phtheirospermum japonicum]
MTSSVSGATPQGRRSKRRTEHSPSCTIPTRRRPAAGNSFRSVTPTLRCPILTREPPTILIWELVRNAGGALAVYGGSFTRPGSGKRISAGDFFLFSRALIC